VYVCVCVCERERESHRLDHKRLRGWSHVGDENRVHTCTHTYEYRERDRHRGGIRERVEHTRIGSGYTLDLHWELC
jgi:hypothetical protein